MGFFDGLTDVVGEWAPILNVGADIYGAYSTNKANKKANKAEAKA